MNPPIEAVAIAAIAVAICVLLVPMSFRRRRPHDPQRAFTEREREMGFSRAGGRCELGVFRCRSRASHGDHYYPWSKGGATTMRNFVAACTRCNTSKGARVPGVIGRAVLISRRRRYFPAGVPTDAGEWFGNR